MCDGQFQWNGKWNVLLLVRYILYALFPQHTVELRTVAFSILPTEVCLSWLFLCTATAFPPLELCAMFTSCIPRCRTPPPSPCSPDCPRCTHLRRHNQPVGHRMFSLHIMLRTEWRLFLPAWAASPICCHVEDGEWVRVPSALSGHTPTNHAAVLT